MLNVFGDAPVVARKDLEHLFADGHAHFSADQAAGLLIGVLMEGQVCTGLEAELNHEGFISMAQGRHLHPGQQGVKLQLISVVATICL